MGLTHMADSMPFFTSGATFRLHVYFSAHQVLFDKVVYYEKKVFVPKFPLRVDAIVRKEAKQFDRVASSKSISIFP